MNRVYIQKTDFSFAEDICKILDLRVIDVLPKNPVGKVLRRELKNLFN